MYTHAAFELTDQDTIREIVRQNGFATLFTQNEQGPEATHIPLLWIENCLIGHLARANRFFVPGQSALAIFHGPHAYISPTWYESQPAVPTWNYIAVHVTGRLYPETDENTAAHLAALVGQYEPDTTAYSYESLPTGYREKMQKGITAFRLEIEKVQAKAKLSQNHSAERRARVIAQLDKNPDTQVQQLARYMRQLSP